MIEVEKLKKYAGKLMFDMEDSEYETLQKEFEIITKQMDLIAEFEGIDKIEPMTFPYDYKLDTLRDDDKVRIVDNKTILRNAGEIEGREVSVPKVVE